MLVETKQLSKVYRSLRALDSCTLSIERGEVFGLLGPNGSGKTTLLRLLMGYLQPTSGAAQIGGLDCYRQSVNVHRLVAYLPGEVRLSPRMLGRDVLEFFSRVRHSNLQLATFIAARLGLDLSRQVARMSTGMRQKLALAAVFATRAEILILDEPTSNLDPTVRAEVGYLVAEVKAEGRTVIFSSHVLSEVEQVCDRVAVLRTGKLVALETLAQVQRRHRIQARLTGPLTPAPPAVKDKIRIHHLTTSTVRIDTPGELSPLLGWLATLPIAEVNIESIGLQVIYEQHHGSAGSSAGALENNA